MSLAPLQEKFGLAAAEQKLWLHAAKGLLFAAEEYERHQQPGDAARCLEHLKDVTEAWLLSLGAAPIWPDRSTSSTKKGNDRG